MNKFLSVLVLGVLLSTSACEKKEERVLPKVETAVQLSAEDQARFDREAFISKAQNEIDEQGARLAELRKKTVDASGNAKENLNTQVMALEQEQKRVDAKLADMRSAVGDKWKEFQAEVTAAIEQFKQSVKNAI